MWRPRVLIGQAWMITFRFHLLRSTMPASFACSERRGLPEIYGKQAPQPLHNFDIEAAKAERVVSDGRKKGFQLQASVRE